MDVSGIEIDIKEEIIYPEYKDEDININENELNIKEDPLSKNNKDIPMHLLPIVFTKKLDDMSIFKEDVKIKDAKHFLESIEIESKLQDYEVPKNIVSNPSIKKEKIERVVSKLVEILYKHKPSNIHDKNNKNDNTTLLEVCKTARVILHDIRFNSHLEKMNELNNMSIPTSNNSIIDLIAPTYISIENMNQWNQISKRIDVNSSHNVTKCNKVNAPSIEPSTDLLKKMNVTVLFKHEYCSEVDIYCFDTRKNLVEYRTVHTDSQEKILSDIQLAEKIITLPCCCWYGRQSNIDFIINSPLLSSHSRSNFKYFMRKPHYCPLEKCKCCCKSITKALKHPTIGHKTGSIINFDLSECNYAYNNAIVSDFDQRLHTKNANGLIVRALLYHKPVTTINKEYVKKPQEISSHKHTIQIHTVSSKSLHTDTYEITDGEIYSIHSRRKGLPPNIHKGEPRNTQNIRCVDAYNVVIDNCCWYDRQMNIKKLTAFYINPKIFNYLKSPLSLYKSPVCYKYCQKKKNIIPYKKTLQCKTLTPPSHTGKFVLKYNCKLSKKKLNSNEDDPDTLTRNVVLNVNCSPETNENVNYLIEDILQRFRDVRLTVNEFGKIAVALDAPISSLSTEDLKVLAKILTFAQSQVQSLGLTPGNQVQLKLPDTSKLNVGKEAVPSINKTHCTPAQNQSQCITTPQNQDIIVLDDDDETVDNSIIEKWKPRGKFKDNKSFPGWESFKRNVYRYSFNFFTNEKLPTNHTMPVISDVFSINKEVINSNQPQHLEQQHTEKDIEEEIFEINQNNYKRKMRDEIITGGKKRKTVDIDQEQNVSGYLRYLQERNKPGPKVSNRTRNNTKNPEKHLGQTAAPSTQNADKVTDPMLLEMDDTDVVFVNISNDEELPDFQTKTVSFENATAELNSNINSVKEWHDPNANNECILGI